MNLERENEILDLYMEIKTGNPQLVNEFTSIVLMDVTVKNGGFINYLDYGRAGINFVSEFSSVNKIESLFEICEYCEMLICKYNGIYDKLLERELEILDDMSNAYYDISPLIIDIIYNRYLKNKLAQQVDAPEPASPAR